MFDVESREMEKDLEYYQDCLQGLSQFSKDANVFLLGHKVDPDRTEYCQADKSGKRIWGTSATCSQV